MKYEIENGILKVTISHAEATTGKQVVQTNSFLRHPVLDEEMMGGLEPLEGTHEFIVGRTFFSAGIIKEADHIFDKKDKIHHLRHIDLPEGFTIYDIAWLMIQSAHGDINCEHHDSVEFRFNMDFMIESSINYYNLEESVRLLEERI